jgi:hypothetical protein
VRAAPCPYSCVLMPCRSCTGTGRRARISRWQWHQHHHNATVTSLAQRLLLPCCPCLSRPTQTACSKRSRSPATPRALLCCCLQSGRCCSLPPSAAASPLRLQRCPPCCSRSAPPRGAWQLLQQLLREQQGEMQQDQEEAVSSWTGVLHTGCSRSRQQTHAPAAAAAATLGGGATTQRRLLLLLACWHSGLLRSSIARGRAGQGAIAAFRGCPAAKSARVSSDPAIPVCVVRGFGSSDVKRGAHATMHASSAHIRSV